MIITMNVMLVQLITQLELLVLIVILSSSVPIAAALATTTAGPITKPCCDDHCGNVSIPCPFGMTKGCYLDQDFLISCNHSCYPSQPYFGEKNLSVTNISLEGQLRILHSIGSVVYNMRYKYNEALLTLTKFTISNELNKFVAIGCDTYAIVRGYQGDQAGVHDWVHVHL
uniref:Putative Wall-associated kinase 2 n=1 Tax=Davidia involucrata TaxID=16924 RepID=A0A5B7C6D8_DAVIN